MKIMIQPIPNIFRINKIVGFLIIFLTLSCAKTTQDRKSEERIDEIEISNTNNSKTNLKEESRDDRKESDVVFIDSANFKFFKLEEFNLDDWYIGKMNTELTALTKEKLHSYFQNNRMYDENVYVENFRYFSIQKNTDSEKIITILESDESCCTNLHLLIYNDQDELISDNIVAGTGGDGMWSYNQFGKFINDSTYIQTRIDTEEVELRNKRNEIRMDSVITSFRFYKNKPLLKLTEQKFKK